MKHIPDVKTKIDTMNLPLFIAKKIHKDTGDNVKVSRPVIRIATLGVAIGLAIMIITVAVVIGFKHTIRDKVIGFGSHIKIENLLTQQSPTPLPISIDDSITKKLMSVEGIGHIERFATTQGILKTDSDFYGIVLKGVGPEYNLTFLRQNITEGEIPTFSDKENQNKLLISRMIADKLKLNVGDKIFAYFISTENVRARRFKICGIYETNMTQFDKNLCFTDIYTTIKLNGWEKDQYSGAEVQVKDFDNINKNIQDIENAINRKTDKYGETYTSHTIYESYPQIFSWLELLDINVWIILILMVCVAGFTMISGLLIIILEQTQMIGTLKALGANNKVIRKTFLWFSFFILVRGLLLGNILGIGLVFLQTTTGIVSLDPSTYYVKTAPMELNIIMILLINIATLLISMLVLIAPSYMIAHIHPAKSIRYE